MCNNFNLFICIQPLSFAHPSSLSLMRFNGTTFFHLTLAQAVNEPDQQEYTTDLFHSFAQHTPTLHSLIAFSLLPCHCL